MIVGADSPETGHLTTGSRCGRPTGLRAFSPRTTGRCRARAGLALKQTPASGARKPVQRHAWVDGFVYIDALDAQDFFWRRLACRPGHPQIRTRNPPESASRATATACVATRNSPKRSIPLRTEQTGDRPQRQRLCHDDRAPGPLPHSGRSAPSVGQRDHPATFRAQNPAIFYAL